MFLDVCSVNRCGCGYILWGEDEEELLRDAEDHVRTVHPELVGTLSPLELAEPSIQDEAVV
jgi:predicted small metal-binding protein